jgi:hypothetical protein
VIIDVSEPADGSGWHVDIGSAQGDAAVSASLTMDALVVEEGWRVPVAPGGRDEKQDDHLLRLARRVDVGSIDPGDVAAYGHWLFQCLLEPAWPRITESPAVRDRGGVELALRWPADSCLHRLVWEAMHDGTRPLAASPDLLVAVTRLVPVRGGNAPAPTTGIPRALFATGSPLTDETIRPGAMIMGLVRQLDADGACVSRVEQHVSLRELAEDCRAFAPDVVTLIAHGDLADGSGVVKLKSRSGSEPEGYGAEELASALISPGHAPAAVLLAVCQSAVSVRAAPLAARLVELGVPVVSAVAGDISEQACRLYTRHLVKALVGGACVVEAAADGRRAAIVETGVAADRLDWAMPALFAADCTPPGLRVVDPRRADTLETVAKELELRRRPLYIEPPEVMTYVRRLFTDDQRQRLGLVAFGSDDSISGLGGTRLLREIGLNLLRSGHIPVMLGPYGPADVPGSVRAVFGEIMLRVVRASHHLHIRPELSRVLPGNKEAGALVASAAAARDEETYHELMLEAVSAFRAGSEPWPEADIVRMRLRRDLYELATAAGELPEPFGPHTQVVVLADELDRWCGALDGLVELVKGSGLGTFERPVPFIFTACYTSPTGEPLRHLRDANSGQPGFAFPRLQPLPQHVASLGFQWVLLHPWEAHPEVFVRAPTASPEQISEALMGLGGKPTQVRDMLYVIAKTLVTVNVLHCGDDEAAFQSYLRKYK